MGAGDEEMFMDVQWWDTNDGRTIVRVGRNKWGKGQVSTKPEVARAAFPEIPLSSQELYYLLTLSPPRVQTNGQCFYFFICVSFDCSERKNRGKRGEPGCEPPGVAPGQYSRFITAVRS